MALRLLAVLTVLWLGLVAIQAATPSELYWKSVLPNTPMPKAVEDILSPDVLEEESTSVGVGKGGVGVRTGKGTTVGVGKGGVGVRTGRPGGGTTVGVGKGGVGVRTGRGGRTRVGVGKGGVNVGTPGKKGKPPVVVRVIPGHPFNYNYAASQDQMSDDRQTTVFFLEKDLSPSTEMNLLFTKSANGATFLPRQVSDSLPFSSAKLSSILSQFSIAPGSVEAEEVKQTVSECEQPAAKGEEKYCATSLESIVDFATSKLGKNVQAVSTEVDRETPVQKYTVLKGVKKIGGANGEAVVCHKENYPYAVFYCHATSTTRAYVVPLVGADGTRAEATAVCHTDTASWNPKHLAFQVLNVKPGTLPVCHFLPEDHIVWTQK
uniref:BURP domain-containing protein n=1 Tax=Kalanchoe fedtschenkoi TaxID=63787 RepID=A0A7N0TMI4_KALFE